MYHDGSSLYLWHVQSLRPGGASLWLSLSLVPAAESDRGWDIIVRGLGVDTGTWERPRHRDTPPCYYCESMFVLV